MRGIRIGLSLLILSAFVQLGCDSGNGANKLGADQPAATAPSADAAPLPENLVDVTGCQGTTGDLTAAKTALENSEFQKANCIASQLFNASVMADVSHPDTQAAFIAVQARVALLTETPEMTYLMTAGSQAPLKAKDYFGPLGDIGKLSSLMRDRWPSPFPLPFPQGQGIFYAFLKAHNDQGHSVHQVLDQLADLLIRQAPDFHHLTEAIAHDSSFNGKIKSLFQLSTEFTATSTEGAIVNMWVNLLSLGGKLAHHYDTGLATYDSLKTSADLLSDLNTDPKLLGLRGSSDGSYLIPLVQQTLESGLFAGEKALIAPPQSWVGDLFPKDHTDINRLKTTAQELLESLQGKWVWLSVTDYKDAVDLKRAFTQLPNAANYPGPVVELTGSSEIDLKSDFVKFFLSSFMQHLP